MDGELTKQFRKHLPHVHWQRIESAMTGGGIPDLNGCMNGFDFWLELKKATHWKLDTPVTPDQVAWAERRVRCGGHAGLACRRAGVELWLLRVPAMRMLLLGARLNALPPHLIAGKWQNGPARWDWSAIALRLKSL